MAEEWVTMQEAVIFSANLAARRGPGFDPGSVLFVSILLCAGEDGLSV